MFLVAPDQDQASVKGDALLLELVFTTPAKEEKELEFQATPLLTQVLLTRHLKEPKSGLINNATFGAQF